MWINFKGVIMDQYVLVYNEVAKIIHDMFGFSTDEFDADSVFSKTFGMDAIYSLRFMFECTKVFGIVLDDTRFLPASINNIDESELWLNGTVGEFVEYLCKQI